MVRSFMLGATKQGPGSASVADEAIDSLLELLGVFVADLSGAYSAGGTAAHWFKVNQPPVPTPAFTGLLSGLDSVLDALRNASIACPPSLLPAIDRPSSGSHGGEAGCHEPHDRRDESHDCNCAAMTAGLAPATAACCWAPSAMPRLRPATLGSLSLAAPLAQLRRSHAAIQAFFEQSDPSTRMMEQYLPPRHPHEVPCLPRLLSVRPRSDPLPACECAPGSHPSPEQRGGLRGALHCALRIPAGDLELPLGPASEVEVWPREPTWRDRRALRQPQ